MNLPPPNIAREDEADEAAWQARERALRGEPTQEVAAGLLLRLTSAVPAAGAILGMAAWTVGQVVSDRYWWSQFLEWMPTVLVVAAAGVLLALAETARRLMRRARPGDRSVRRLTRAIGVGAGWWAVIVVYFVQVEMGGARMLGAGRGAPAGATPMRVLFWNSGAEDLANWTPNIVSAKPALCVFTSILHDEKLVELVETMTPDPVKQPVWMYQQDRFTVLSRVKLLRVGFLKLGISKGSGLDPREQGPERYYDPGRAMFVEIDGSLLAGTGADVTRPVVVWVVDLPSDLSLPRALVTEQAAQAIAGFQGPVLRMDESGRWVEDARGGSMGFPPADVMVGDFNIPRGSWSLGRLAGMQSPPMTDAWSQAGHGYTATYPRRRSLLHTDQIFVGERLRAVEYEAFSAGTGTHKGVWGDLVGK